MREFEMEMLSLTHILTGALAVAAGAIALGAHKGGAIHVAGGRSFAVLMATSAGLGAVLGLVNMETVYITFHAGVLALYLIVSGWFAAREDRVSKRAVAAPGVVNLANVAALTALGFVAGGAAQGRYLGFPAEDYFFLAGMAGLGAAGDGLTLLRKTLSQRHRIARHLWRMCFGFFIAAGSAFTGPGASAFPQAVRQSGLLSLPEVVIMALMLFWLVRTLLSRPRTDPGGAATDGIE
ncbi:MAG: hypothetical protein ACX939_08550 [Hyphococcus sp.]